MSRSIKSICLLTSLITGGACKSRLIPHRKFGEFSIFLFLSLIICVFGQSSYAQTSIYIFETNQSTVVQTGGFAGVHETYLVEGRFRLSVDFDAGSASFEIVDANLTDETGSEYGRSLDEIFNMTALAGAIIDDTTIEFNGKTADGTESDVRLKLSFSNDSAHLTGKTTPPPDSADMFYFNLDTVAHRKYAGGTGEPNNPYQIATAEDLTHLGETPEDYDKHFILTADIDLDPNLPGRKVFDKAVIAADTNDIKSSLQGTPFKGVFDGNGYVVSRLTIIGRTNLGLFGLLGDGEIRAEVRNLGVVDVNTAGWDYIGGLVGISDRASVVTQCYSTGSVNGRDYIGGLIGKNYGSVTQCYSTAAVLGAPSGSGSNDGLIGGLVGENSGALTDCYSIGSVGCYSPENSSYCVESTVGGLVGRNDAYRFRGIVVNCFWDVETSGQPSSDGGIGLTTAEMQNADTFMAWGTCGNEGIWTIDDGRDYPKLWWQNLPGEPIAVGATLSDFLTGEGTEDNPYLIYTPDELNLIGLFQCDWDKHYKLMADIDMSGFDGKDGKPSFNIIAPGYVYGFEVILNFRGTPFTGIFDGNGHTISNLTVEADTCGGMFGGLGAAGEIRDLGVMDVNVVGSYCVGGLVGFSAYGASVTQCYSTGEVSGNGDIGGLVGINSGNITTSSSTCMVSGTGWSIGGLVGENIDRITTSYSAGPVSGDSGVGGLVGYNYHLRSSLIQCYSTSTVKGDYGVGGLVGGNGGGSVTQCYSTGAVSGDSEVGGLAGSNVGAAVTFCYSTGSVSGTGSFVGGLVGINAESNISKSFWDIETSGLSNMCGDNIGDDMDCDDSLGKTTVEMQDINTYLSEGWDFVDETDNGTENIWWILEGQGYPRLWWEQLEEQINDPNEI